MEIEKKYSVTLIVSGFESDHGMAFLMLLNENKVEIAKKIVSIKNKLVTYKFVGLKKGFYAIKTFHDANNNNKLDTNLFGIPKDKWGVSNNIAASFGPPDFKKMMFEVKSDTEIAIKLQ